MTDGAGKKKQGHTHTYSHPHAHRSLHSHYTNVSIAQRRMAVLPLSHLLLIEIMCRVCPAMFPVAGLVSGLYTANRQQTEVAPCEVIWVSLIPPDSCHSPSRCHPGVDMQPLL